MIASVSRCNNTNQPSTIKVGDLRCSRPFNPTDAMNSSCMTPRASIPSLISKEVLQRLQQNRDVSKFRVSPRLHEASSARQHHQQHHNYVKTNYNDSMTARACSPNLVEKRHIPLSLYKAHESAAGQATSPRGVAEGTVFVGPSTQYVWRSGEKQLGSG